MRNYRATILAQAAETRGMEALETDELAIANQLLDTYDEFYQASMGGGLDEADLAELDQVILQQIVEALPVKSKVAATEEVENKGTRADEDPEEGLGSPAMALPTPAATDPINPLLSPAAQTSFGSSSGDASGLVESAQLSSAKPAGRGPVAVPVGDAPIMVTSHRTQPPAAAMVSGQPAVVVPGSYPGLEVVAVGHPHPAVPPVAPPVKPSHYHNRNVTGADVATGVMNVVGEVGALYGQYQVTNDLAHGRPVELSDAILASMGHDGRRGLGDAVLHGAILHQLYGGGSTSAPAVAGSNGAAAPTFDLGTSLGHAAENIGTMATSAAATVAGLGSRAVNTVGGLGSRAVDAVRGVELPNLGGMAHNASAMAHGAVSTVISAVQPMGDAIGGVLQNAGELAGGVGTLVGQGAQAAAHAVGAVGEAGGQLIGAVVEVGGNMAGAATNCCGFFATAANGAGDCLTAVPEVAETCCGCLGGILGALDNR